MIEVRLWTPSDGGGECMACDPPADPPFILTRVGGSPSTWSTRYCEDCACKILGAMMFVLGSNTRQRANEAIREANRKINAPIPTKRISKGPHWLTEIERLKPGDPCEFRYPARSNWCLGIVVENGGSGYWKIKRTTSDADGENGDIVDGIYIEGVRRRGQTEAWPTLSPRRCGHIVDNYTNEVCGIELPCSRHR